MSHELDIIRLIENHWRKSPLEYTSINCLNVVLAFFCWTKSQVTHFFGHTFLPPKDNIKIGEKYREITKEVRLTQLLEDKCCNERLTELRVRNLEWRILRRYYVFPAVYKCPHSDSLHDKNLSHGLEK